MTDREQTRRDRRGENEKDLLADALRHYPIWGHAWIAARDLLLDIEGTIIAYWTDVPEAELERLRQRIREVVDGG